MCIGANNLSTACTPRSDQSPPSSFSSDADLHTPSNHPPLQPLPLSHLQQELQQKKCQKLLRRQSSSNPPIFSQLTKNCNGSSSRNLPNHRRAYKVCRPGRDLTVPSFLRQSHNRDVKNNTVVGRKSTRQVNNTLPYDRLGYVLKISPIDQTFTEDFSNQYCPSTPYESLLLERKNSVNADDIQNIKIQTGNSEARQLETSKFINRSEGRSNTCDSSVSVFDSNTYYAQYQTQESTNIEKDYIFPKRVEGKLNLEIDKDTNENSYLADVVQCPLMYSTEACNIASQDYLKCNNISSCVYCGECRDQIHSPVKEESKRRKSTATQADKVVTLLDNPAPPPTTSNTTDQGVHQVSMSFTLSQLMPISNIIICHQNVKVMEPIEKGLYGWKLPSSLTRFLAGVMVLIYSITGIENDPVGHKMVPSTAGSKKMDNLPKSDSSGKRQRNFVHSINPGQSELSFGCGFGATRSSVLLVLTLLLAGVLTTEASEFPDRECCDSVPPPPPHYHSATSTTTTKPPPHQYRFNASIINKLGSKHGAGVMSCLEARAQCYNELRCRNILNMHHKICGPELAACSTVTPIKCQRLLLSLRSFDYFMNCRCAETHIDYTCYTFRQTIFEHPCNLLNFTGMSRKYRGSNDAKRVLSTCDEAHKECTDDKSCIPDLMSFKINCKEDNDRCLAQDRQQCYESWTKVRLSPIFGCICLDEPQTMHSVSQPVFGTFARVPTDQLRRSPIHGLNMASKEDGECMKIYNFTHNNPCLRKETATTTAVEEVQELCHMSLQACQRDAECSPLLDKVMMWCEHTHCEPDRCRGALQNFYDSVSIQRRLEVAFCVCRQNDNDGQCLTAMRKLHPNCAERNTGADPQQCHEIARQCRDNDNCRRRLEAYERHCAADAVTGNCSGSHRACQHAVTSILGTELHASCVCKGTDFLHLQDCYSWHKLLWSNPCVIESHLSLQKEIKNGNSAELDEVFTRAPQTTSTPYSTSTSTLPPDMDDYGRLYLSPDGTPLEGSPYPTGKEQAREDPFRGRGEPYGRGQYFRVGPPGTRPRGRPPGPGMDGRMNPNVNAGGFRHVPPSQGAELDKPGITKGIQVGGPPSRWSGSNRYAGGRKGVGVGVGVQRPPGGVDVGGVRRRHQYPQGAGGEPLATDGSPDGALVPSYHRVGAGRGPNGEGGGLNNYTNGLEPVDTCLIEEEVEGKSVRTWAIPVNGSRRLMRGEAGCSDMCLCQKTEAKKVPTVSCFALTCINQTGCNTTKAVFSHTAPYVQAFRGLCICYSGQFICQRPAPDQFKPGPGVYLFLGYSRDEMRILKPHTLMNEIEALKEIEKLLKEKYGFKCKLIMKEQIDQNLILMPELDDAHDPEELSDTSDPADPYQKHRREMDECTKPLEDLAEWINKRPRDNDVHTDAYLSMFILAEVHVNISEAQASQLSIAIKLATTAATALATTVAAALPVSVGLYWSWAVTQAEAALLL